MIKLAISNLAWEKRQDKKLQNILEKVNADIEIAATKVWNQPTKVSKGAAKEYKAFWDSAGIKIVALQSLLFGHPELRIFSDQKTRNKTLDYLKRIINLASLLEAKNLIFGSPENRFIKNLPKEKVKEISLSFFTLLANATNDYNVTICLEPNPPQYKCNFINSVKEGIEFVNLINNKGLKLNLDTACMTLIKDDPVENILFAKKILKHFHISEPHLRPVGTNKVKHRLFSSAIRKINYQGYVSVEMLTGDSGNNLSIIEKSLNYTKKVYLNSD